MRIILSYYSLLIMFSHDCFSRSFKDSSPLPCDLGNTIKFSASSDALCLCLDPLFPTPAHGVLLTRSRLLALLHP